MYIIHITYNVLKKQFTIRNMWAEMHSQSRCKYVPEITCPKTFTCIECFKEEDVWVKRWVRYLKIQEYMHYPAHEIVQNQETKKIRTETNL